MRRRTRSGVPACERSARRRRALTRASGQSAVVVALIMPFLVAFALMVVEVAERWLEVAMVEDALQQATRSAVQTLDYAALAHGDHSLRAATCRAVTTGSPGDCAEIVGVATRFLLINLGGVRGLDEEPAELAARVRWTVLPHGGTCAYSLAPERSITEATPLICAEVRPRMRGLVGWGSFQPLIIAADTLDPARP
ncbi:MAG: hypothetical protein OHK0015_41580 [Chloroflexi bacterium OHK40]